MLYWFAQPAFTGFLAVITPTLAFTALNLRFFTVRQAWTAVLLAFAFAVMVGSAMYVICGWVAELALTASAISYGISLPNALCSLTAVILFFTLHERFFSETLTQPRQRHLVMCGSALFFVASATLYSLWILNAVLALFTVGACLDGLRARNAPKEPLFALSTFRQYYSAHGKRNVVLKHTPNIYVLLLESYHSAEAMQTLYGIDDSATDALFSRHNFADYKRVFCNEPATVASLHTLLDCTLLGHAPHARQKSFVLDVLRENGYSCEFFDSSFFVFGHLMCKDEFAAFDMPPHVRLLYALAGPVWAQSRHLRKLVKNFDPFTTDIDFAHIFSALKSRISMVNAAPRCFCMRFGACHVANVHQGWVRDASGFMKQYIDAVHTAQQHIEMVVEAIMVQDPNALVVAIGDHGSLRHSNAWRGLGGEVKALQDHGVSMRELALDHFGVRLAVRWPVEHKIMGQVLSHVNVFRFVLDALGGEGLLDTLQPNISLLEGRYVVVREAQPLDMLEQYHPAEAMQDLRLRFEAGKSSEEECLTLALGLESTDKVFTRRVLEWAEKRYSGTRVDAMLGRVLLAYGDPQSLVRLKRAMDNSPEDVALQVQYANALLSFSHGHKILQWLGDTGHSVAEPQLAFIVMRAHCCLGDSAQAVRYADDFIAKFPAMPASYFYAGMLQCGLHSYDAACALAEQGLAIGGSKKTHDLYYHLYRLYAVSLIRTQQWDKAEAVCRLLCSIHSADVWSWLLWAYACDARGDTTQAMQVLLQAANTCSNDSILRRIGHLARKHHITNAALAPFIRLADEELLATQQLFAQVGIVDAQWYRTQSIHDPTARFPHRHYPISGVYQGCEPVPWFDSFFYLLAHPAVWSTGMNPFIHCMQHGIVELREMSLCCYPMSILSMHPELREDAHGLLQKLHQQWSQQYT